MHRIDHRRLHWVLGGASVLSLAAVTLQGLGIPSVADIGAASGSTSGAPSGVGRIDASGTSHRPDMTSLEAEQNALSPLPVPISPDRFAQVWHRNVFSASRVPDVHRNQQAEAPMSGYTLTGVILSGALRIALLTDPAGKGYSVLIGHALPHTAWRLSAVDRRAAHFDVDGQDVTLPLRKTPYAMGPSAIPGGPADRSDMHRDSDSDAGSSQQSASNDALGATQPRGDQRQTGTPGLPPLPPGM